jgi:methionine aminopeptidase
MSSKQCKLDNPTAVIGELAKRLQAKYGDEVLTVFGDVLKEYGYQSGLKLSKKMTNVSFPERITTWLEPFIKTGKSEVVEMKTDLVTMKGHDCPLNLEGSNRKLCEALMKIDVGLASALAGKDIILKIEKSLACGDEHCLVTFSK